STIDVPFDVWHTILRQVYADIDAWADLLDDPEYVLTPLRQRYLIHLNLALISKHFHELSSSIFLEDLVLYGPLALKEFSTVLTKRPHVGRVVRKLTFSFWHYRCGASYPPRGPERKEITYEVPIESGWDPIAQSAARARRKIDAQTRSAWLAYQPSGTKQPQHWVGWTGFVRTIVSHCSGLQSVDINAQADYSRHLMKPSARTYQTLWGDINLNNDSILSGLVEATNLRSLRIVNPTPLDEFGGALSRWPLLRHAEIVVTEDFPEARELADAVFTPPRYLQSFRLSNRSNFAASLPSTADLSQCKDLSVLDIGLLNLSDAPTVLGAGYLISAYQHSLTELTLRVRPRGRERDITVTMQNGNLRFPLLKRFTAKNASCDETMFVALVAEELEYIEVRSLTIPAASISRFFEPHRPSSHSQAPSDPPQSSEDATRDSPEYRFWVSFFRRSAFGKLKIFKVLNFTVTVGTNPGVGLPETVRRGSSDLLRQALTLYGRDRNIDVSIKPEDFEPELFGGPHPELLGLGPHPGVADGEGGPVGPGGVMMGNAVAHGPPPFGVAHGPAMEHIGVMDGPPPGIIPPFATGMIQDDEDWEINENDDDDDGDNDD
ncbi:hypothetical protein DL93DRAFT_2073145, partial [Clavulina sp. PMI_390]